VTEDNSEREAELLKLIDELTAEVHRLQTSDALTGVLSRQGFLHAAEQTASVARRGGRDSVLLIVEILGLPYTNEALGQDEGDRLIRDAAALVQRTLRTVDLVGRWGGAEIVGLMPDCSDPHSASQRLMDSADAWVRSPRIAIDVTAVTLLVSDERSVEVVLAEVTGVH
jgi:diguanylate cyclase (GGDEF)-like protein